MVSADFVPDGKDKAQDELRGLKQQQWDPEGSDRFIPAQTAAPGQKYSPQNQAVSLAWRSAWNQPASLDRKAMNSERVIWLYLYNN